MGVKSVYIITDIMKASRLTAVVTGDDDSWERISLGSLPIGFRYSKFRLTSGGLVAEQVNYKNFFFLFFSSELYISYLFPLKIDENQTLFQRKMGCSGRSPGTFSQRPRQLIADFIQSEIVLIFIKIIDFWIQ